MILLKPVARPPSASRVGYPLAKPVRDALLGLEQSAWQPAIDADGHDRERATVAELTGRVNLPG
jgi:hypothetical protein